MAKNTLILQIGPTDSFHLCASNMMEKSRNGYFSVILKSFYDGGMQWMFNLWTKKTRGARGWEKLQLLKVFLWKLQWNELLQEKEREFGSLLFFERNNGMFHKSNYSLLLPLFILYNTVVFVVYIIIVEFWKSHINTKGNSKENLSDPKIRQNNSITYQAFSIIAK